MDTTRHIFRSETWRYLAATLIPVLLLTGLVFAFARGAAEERHIVRMEQIGTRFVHELYFLSRSLHKARLQAELEADGLTMERGSRNAVEEALAIVDRLSASPAARTFRVSGKLAALRSRIGQAFDSGRQDPEARESLMASVQAIRLTVADRSTLILDPDLSSHHLMNLQVNRLPRLLDSTTRFLSLEIRRAAGETLSVDDSARLGVLREAFHQEVGQLTRDMGAVAASVPELAPHVTPFAVRMEEATAGFDRLFARWDRKLPASPLEVFREGEELYRPGTALYHEAHDLLLRLLEAREKRFTRMLAGGMLAGLLIAITVLYFATGYYRTSRRNRASHEELIRQLDAIGTAQGEFIAGGKPRLAFERLLDALLAATGSGYGFMGDLYKQADGSPCLRVQAVREISRSRTARVSRASVLSGDNTLVVHVLDRGEPLTVDTPQEAARMEGLPPGHPPVDCLLAIPIFKGPRMLGMVAVANRSGGYASQKLETLQPILHTFANVLAAHRVDGAAREAEQALRDSLVRHRTVLETMVDALITIDDQGTIETFNSAAESMFGYSAREVIGKPVTLLMPDQPRPQTEDRMDGTHANGIAVHAAQEVRAVRKDGSGFPAELSMGRMRVGGKALFSGIVRDLTERHAAERALRESGEGMMLAQRIAHLGHWIWDVRSGVLTWSEEIHRIFGLDPQLFSATYKTFLQAVHPDDRNKVTDAVQAALNGSRAYEVEHRVVRPDGAVRTVHEQGEISRDPDTGQPLRMVGTVQDITERKQLEEELSERVAELEASKREIQGFYHTLSHELKTPLTSAREFTLIIKDGLAGPLTDEQTEYLSDVEESCNQMTVIINDLVDATRLETGKLAIDPQPVSVVELAERAVGTVAERATQKGVSLNQSIADPLPRVVADPHRITQVLSNLLTNAIKFTPEKGDIQLIAAPRPGDPAMVAITVRDSGRGMNREQMAHVFQRFYQIEKEDAHSHQGLGLGLYICRELVQLHGGTISIDSTPGKGSDFTFTLPAEPDLPHSSRTAEKRSAPGASG